jgi:hypothetical protein
MLAGVGPQDPPEQRRGNAPRLLKRDGLAVIVAAAPLRFDCGGDRPRLAGGLEFGGQPSLEVRFEGGRREHAGLTVGRHGLAAPDLFTCSRRVASVNRVSCSPSTVLLWHSCRRDFMHRPHMDSGFPSRILP